MPKPICTNCRWSRTLGAYPTCHAPQGRWAVEYLSGSTSTEMDWEFCNIQRADIWPIAVVMRTCGRSGRWFQPKEASDA